MLGPYKLNTIVTGDARELAKAIPEESVDLVLTDPPFGIGFKYSHDFKDIPEREYPDFLRWVIRESERVAKPGAPIFIFQAMGMLKKTWPLFPDDSRIFANCKNFVQMNRGDIPHAFDPVIFWQKPGGKLWAKNGRDWFLANTANTNNRGLSEAGFHSCPRPLDSIIYMIETFSPPAGLVIDWFMGSGTTALASKILGRNYWGCEIDPETAALARKRVEMTQPPLFVMQPTQDSLL